VVSLGRVGEYSDEDDIHNSGTTFDEPPPKRKKLTISKRSQSMKIPSTSSAKWEDYGKAVTHQGEGHEEQASQLTTPPDSFKRKQTKVGSGASKHKSRQTSAFKNPTITKPSIGREKETVPSRSSSVISHQGWRSTEESVKSAPVVLAKTTMEKLASFTFKPPADPQATHVSHPPLNNVSSNIMAELSPHDPLPEPEIVHISSDYDLPSGDTFFNGALLAVRAHTKFNGNDQDQTQPAAEFSPVQVACEESSQKGQSTRYSATCPGYFEDPCEGSTNLYECTSSESRALDDLISAEPNVVKFAQPVDFLKDPVVVQSQFNDYRRIGKDPHSIADDLQNLADQFPPAYNPDQPFGIGSPKPADALPDHRRCSEIQDAEARLTPVVDKDAALVPVENILNNTNTPKQALATYEASRRHKIVVEVERSDINEPEMASKGTSRDLWGSDEFDQDMDDDDFFAVESNAAILQNPEKSQPAQQKNLKVCGRFVLPSPPDGPNPHTRETHIIELISSSPQNITEFDDEYPMDDGDEEEMLKLSELGGGLKESFAPPESVQKAFNDVADGEVYDSSLQFSSPKSQLSGASPSKVARDRHTDQTRILQSPGPPKDSLQLGEEEDWSFLRSDEHGGTETRHDPFHDLRTAPTGRPCQTLSSIPAEPSVVDLANVHTPTQKTNVTSWSIIDDSHEYEPMNPFARPDFPALVLDRSPVVGLSPQTYLRTCFRIGEMFKEGIRCASFRQDAVIELFGRVTFSSREPGSTKQHFQFADLWHDRPPYSNGLLANYKTTGLAESESKVFLSENGKMARCLGRFKRDLKNSVWVLHIIKIRETDWEEIRWTKEIVRHGKVKTEAGWTSANL
jgi:hypothetical protein